VFREEGDGAQESTLLVQRVTADGLIAEFVNCGSELAHVWGLPDSRDVVSGEPQIYAYKITEEKVLVAIMKKLQKRCASIWIWASSTKGHLPEAKLFVS
jgi:hypothetical protein